MYDGRRENLGSHCTAKPRGNDGDAEFAALQFGVDHRPHHDSGIIAGIGLDGIAHCFELANRQVQAAGDIDQYALSASQINVLKQRTRHSHFCGSGRAILTGRKTGTHHRHTGLGHHSADVRKVDIDETRAGDEFSDALNRTLQHSVGGLERIQQRGGRPKYAEELLVRNGDE